MKRRMSSHLDHLIMLHHVRMEDGGNNPFTCSPTHVTAQGSDGPGQVVPGRPKEGGLPSSNMSNMRELGSSQQNNRNSIPKAVYVCVRVS